jgi:hypothetical protein
VVSQRHAPAAGAASVAEAVAVLPAAGMAADIANN